VNIDLAALRALEREREIPYETILAAIETALLTAYRHTEGANPHARVEIDRKTGVATVYAQELDGEGHVAREYDDTPHDFGRIAAMTAKQVILQRLREATDEVHFGEYAGRDGDRAAFTVDDEGPGIVPAARERVLDAFYRLDPARTAGGAAPAGFGLGLTFARRVAEVHGGGITIGPAAVTDGAEHGCRVTLTVPVGEGA